DVEIRLSHNGKPVRLLRPAHDEAALAARVGDILGDEFPTNSLRVDHSGAGMRLSGWLGLPTASRSQPDQQFFYVNGRLVRDRVVTHAVRQAHADVLFHGRHPAYVLFLDLPPEGVDVNVHPAKSEVRFRESRLVHDFLYRTLHEALAETRAGNSPLPATLSSKTGHLPPQAGEGKDSVVPAVWAQQIQRGLGLGVREPLADYAALFGATSASLASNDMPTPENSSSDVPPLGFALAQLAGVYVLAENAHGLVMVDMHAAHERITYERLKTARACDGIHSQPLLVPLTLAVSEREAAAAQEHGDELMVLGFEIA